MWEEHVQQVQWAIREGDYTFAQTELQRLLQQHTDIPEVWIEEAHLSLAQKDLMTAHDALEQAMQIDPEHLD
ncbi:MAG: hypothetical protein AAGJ35_15130, partial [Myxococcota bacterium]